MQHPETIARSGETAERPNGGRHRLTVLFSDLVGSTALSAAMEAEDFLDVLNTLRAIWHDVAAKHDGRVVRTQGDGALIVFGFPLSREDDGRRAVDAALEIHERVRQVRAGALPSGCAPLQMHSGIHAGTLLLSEGDMERGQFELTGDVANIAARLSRYALPDQLLVSRDTLGPYANFYKLDDQSASTDKFAGLRLCAIVGRSTVTRRIDATARSGLTPFVGRVDAIGALARFIDDESANRQRCAFVVGEGGIGKTRLLDELLKRSHRDDVQILRGDCESYLGAAILQPFLQMLRGLLGPGAAPRGGTGSLPADAGARLERILDLVSDDAEAPRSRFAAGDVIPDLLKLFTILSRKKRLVLVIDDWQWADDASRRLLEDLLRIADGPRAILATRPRDDEPERMSGAVHLTIDPFRGAETDLIVRRWVPQADPFLVARIHDYAGGVPLFIEELCHSVSAGNLSQTLEGGGTRSWIATLMASRLARLPSAQARLVQAASVIGNAVPHALLEAAYGEVPDRATLQAVAEADFLHLDPASAGIRFKHGIARDAVYNSIGLHERTSLHRRVEAALLRQSKAEHPDDALEALAYHSRGAQHWDSAARFAERAGDKAMAAFALDRARTQYVVALDALDRVPHRTREESLRWCLLANKLGMASIFDPLSLSDDVAVFERAVALAQSLGDADALARAEYWLGYMCYGFGRFREGVRHARRALAVAREAKDDRLAAQVEAMLGQLLAATCQYDEAIALLDAAVSAKKQHSGRGSGVAIGSAYALSCKGSALADRGEFEAAHMCLDEALSLLGGSTHPVVNSVRNWKAVALIWQGRWAEAERLATESAHVAENTRGLLLLSACRAAAGFSAWQERGSAEGLQQLRDAVRWMDGRRFQFYVSVQYAWLVEASVAVGDFATARRYAALVLCRARQGERLGEAATCRALARAAVESGDLDGCERWLRRADASADFRGSRREAALNEALRGEALAHAGQAERARAMTARAAASLRALDMPWHAEHAAGIVPVRRSGDC